MDMQYGIAVFRSRQQVLLFDSALRRRGLSGAVVSAPAEVAQGCGLAVKFDLGEIGLVKEIYGALRVPNLVGFYKMTVVNGYAQLAPLSGIRVC